MDTTRGRSVVPGIGWRTTAQGVGLREDDSRGGPPVISMSNAPHENDAPVLIGYFAKRRTPAPDELRVVGVEEICNVSECLAPGPADWVEAWLHNEHGCFNSPDDARRVADDAPGDYQLFAYRLLPLRFRRDQTESMEVSAPGIAPLPPDFQSLGFDVVSKSLSSGLGFECSPLSCNIMALEVTVNRHCLVDGFEVARELASRFSVEEPEPGPYYVIEILRCRPSERSTPNGELPNGKLRRI